MIQEQGLSGSEQQALAGNVMDSLGVPSKASEELNSPDEGSHTDGEKDDLPLAAKERLGRQEKRHKKELRAVQDQLQALHARLDSPEHSSLANKPVNPYTQQPIQQGSVEDQIHRAVSYAMNARDEQDKQAKHAELMAGAQRHEQDFRNRLDKGSDKYDDFDDVVTAPHVPFTTSMKNAALVLPNAEDVLYKLGKNPEELKRVSALHPLDQQKELVKLSFSLMNGGNDKGSSASAHRPLDQMKNSPVKSSSVNDTTSVGELRKKMRANWK